MNVTEPLETLPASLRDHVHDRTVTSASDTVEVEGYEGHFENFDGGYTVGFETYIDDADLTPFCAGLPTTSARRRTGTTSSQAE